MVQWIAVSESGDHLKALLLDKWRATTDTHLIEQRTLKKDKPEKQANTASENNDAASVAKLEVQRQPSADKTRPEPNPLPDCLSEQAGLDFEKREHNPSPRGESSAFELSTAEYTEEEAVQTSVTRLRDLDSMQSTFKTNAVATEANTAVSSFEELSKTQSTSDTASVTNSGLIQPPLDPHPPPPVVSTAPCGHMTVVASDSSAFEVSTDENPSRSGTASDLHSLDETKPRMGNDMTLDHAAAPSGPEEPGDETRNRTNGAKGACRTQGADLYLQQTNDDVENSDAESQATTERLTASLTARLEGLGEPMSGLGFRNSNIEGGFGRIVRIQDFEDLEGHADTMGREVTYRTVDSHNSIVETALAAQSDQVVKDFKVPQNHSSKDFKFSGNARMLAVGDRLFGGKLGSLGGRLPEEAIPGYTMQPVVPPKGVGMGWDGFGVFPSPSNCSITGEHTYGQPLRNRAARDIPLPPRAPSYANTLPSVVCDSILETLTSTGVQSGSPPSGLNAPASTRYSEPYIF